MAIYSWLSLAKKKQQRYNGQKTFRCYLQSTVKAKKEKMAIYS